MGDERTIPLLIGALAYEAGEVAIQVIPPSTV
jgi:hypothetical protein